MLLGMQLCILLSLLLGMLLGVLAKQVTPSVKMIIMRMSPPFM